MSIYTNIHNDIADADARTCFGPHPSPLYVLMSFLLMQILHSCKIFSFVLNFSLVCHAHAPPQSTLIYPDFHDMRNFPLLESCKTLWCWKESPKEAPVQIAQCQQCRNWPTEEVSKQCYVVGWLVRTHRNSSTFASSIPLWSAPLLLLNVLSSCASSSFCSGWNVTTLLHHFCASYQTFIQWLLVIKWLSLCEWEPLLRCLCLSLCIIPEELVLVLLVEELV